MSSYSFAVQKAIYQKLVASPAVAGRVYDHVRPTNTTDTVDPYVEIGDSDASADDTSSITGGSDGGISEFFDIHVWSRKHRGSRDVKDVASDIRDRLHEADLTVVGRSSAFCWVRNIRSFTEPDGLTRHSVVSVEVIHRS